MGQVYRAYDATLNRRVAIKLLRPDRDPVSVRGDSATTTPSVTRVLREARMAAALDHPNVVSIFDVGEQDGDPFIVMELVNGRSLRACVGQPEIPMSERVHWLLGIARGLAAAHHAGLVHRDVKPENVLVRDDGVVKVLDFGIARLDRLPSQRPPSVAGMRVAPTPGEAFESTLAGTPAYMAPEQIRRELVDARVDQFAWGVVAYELLTGELPWSKDAGRGGPIAILGAVLERDPPRLSAEELHVAESFVETVHRALSKKREARFGSMDDLLLASGLAFSKGDLPMPGPRPSMPSSADSSQRVNVVPADIASAPTLLATNSAGSLEAAARTAVKRTPSRGKLVAVVVSAALLVAIGIGALRGSSGHPMSAVQGKESTATSPIAFHPRDARRLTFDQGCEEFPSFSPDGASLAFDSTVGDDIQVVVLDVASGAQRRVTSDPGWHFAPAISPDGKSIAYLRQHGDEVGTWVVPFDGSAPARLVASGRLRPSWSPDGSGIWAGSIDHPSRLDLATGETTRKLEAPPGYFILRARDLPDGRVVGRLLDRATKLGRGLVLYAKDSATSVPLFPDVTEDALGLAPDGARLLVSKLLVPTSRVELWQVPLDGSPPGIVPDHLVLPTKGIDFSRDGTNVAWSTCSTEQDIARLDGAGDKLQATALLPKTEWTDDQPAGVPGAPSKMVIVSDRAERRQLWVIDLHDDGARRLPLGDLEAAAPAVSPDGRAVVFTAVGKGIYVVDMDGSSPARPLTSGAEDASPSFAKDGASIYFETASTARHHALARVPIDGSAPPVKLLDQAERPSASPVDDRVVYLASEGEQGTPMIFDVQTKKSRRVSKSLGKGSYGAPHFSPDGTRVAIGVGLNEVVEVDVKSGDVARRFISGDQVTALTYVGGDLVIAREAWRGDVWLAHDPWGPKGGD
jgi:serine/threonine-protein kinase